MFSDSKMSLSERGRKYLVQWRVHRSVHRCDPRKSNTAGRMRRSPCCALDASKTRSGLATPSRRRIAARSLRASGVTPTSCCWKTQLVFWPRTKQEIRRFVRQHVRQIREGGTKRKHANHQGTTKTTKVANNSSARRGVRERTARARRESH